ncbi:MAG: fumarylacetoacetate hydrolase family protein [Alphaproteobacteria bacterium]|jgi:fumarylacetoacetate (FAA) hydrolase|nr:fumarylacetoacetate hydrolase family protein [Alphaproteobacteria bacterium]MBT4542391.1 fumarylacetoacetate hydrolase family protein [Alphaproteobacteria bacterium]MBT4965759.1 fumarylacetoacetate hydrolase family protein [Alphaproteobacteria bacterium]MBT5159622.1 fumarylacetoacetate hydrolase family protein [Alphaproteobacteria bacterium]MBT6385571.1 fumarylacetoacetate hydrolase family protein [Alphaproteobacteria bacterium]
MKLASLKSGRDGRLCVVARDLSRAVEVPHIAPTLQQAIDNWDAVAEELGLVSDRLNAGHAPEAFDLDPTQLAAPLPRAYQWADGSAYVNHVELVRKARGAEMPESFWTDPLMYQGGSDGFIGPRDDILAGDETWGIDFESEVAVITDDVPMGTDVRNAGSHIKLLMLVNDVSLRNLIPGELAKGFGFFHGKPASAFSPVAVTPDELGDAWDGAKVNLPLITDYNGKRFGSPDAGTDMTFNFCDLVAHAAISRTLGAGTVIGSGTVSNLDRSKGSSCLAEIRMLETIDTGAPVTPFMQFSDSVRIEMLDGDGQSIFGAIDQRVVKG